MCGKSPTGFAPAALAELGARAALRRLRMGTNRCAADECRFDRPGRAGLKPWTKSSARWNWPSRSLFAFWCSIWASAASPSTSARFEAAMTSVEHLRAFAKPLGVRILLENIPNELSALQSGWSSLSAQPLRRCGRVLRLRSCSHDERRAAGVRNRERVTSIPPTFTTTPKIAIRISGRAADRSTGNRPWSLLRSAPHTPPLLLEIEGDEKVNPVEKMGEAFEKLEAD